MVDTTTPISTTGDGAQVASEQFHVLSGATQQASANINIFGQSADDAGQALNGLGTHVNEIGKFFENTSDMTKESAASFSLLTVAFLGTSKVFDEFTKRKYDTSGISSIGDEIRDVVDAASKAASAPMALAGMAANFGVAKSVIDSAGGSIGKLKKIVLDAANNMIGGADGAFHFQNAIIQLKGSTGELNSIFDAGANSLQNIDNYVNDQRQSITNLHGATGVAVPTLVEYYHALGQIPGALQNTISASGDAKNMMSEYQGIIQLSHGTQIALGDVIKNTATAWELYGLKGTAALELTSRISELSGKFGINLSDTSGFINNMAKSFQFLGENTRGVSAIFNDFFGGLQAKGLGVKPSIEIIEHMTNSIGKMSMAQKAFLSSRTGGAGGLLGAIEIEKDIRAGNIDKVMDKMRQSLTQQFGGRIMTQDQVKTQGDASQFQKQRLLLQSGAFGNMAKDDESATRLLEALASPNKAKGLSSASALLNEQTQRGASVEDKSNTQLRSIAKILEDIRQQGSMTGQGFLERAMTKKNPKLEAGLTGNIAEATRRSKEAAKGGKLNEDRSVGATGYNQQAFRDASGVVPGITGTIGGLAEQVGSTFMRPKTQEEINEHNKEEYDAKMKERAEMMKNAPTNPAQKAQYLKNIQANEDKRAKMMRPGEAVGRTLANATRGSQQRAAAASQGHHTGASSKEKTNFTINVFVDGKKKVSQYTIDDTDGGPSMSED